MQLGLISTILCQSHGLLTLCHAGGVVVRYITGKGLHSSAEGPRIRPAVLALLAERGVPHVEGPGWVEATIGGAHNSGREQR